MMWWHHLMETFSVSLALCVGNSLVPSEFPHKGQWRGALMFSLICPWINASINNREAGDLRCHCAHYDVIVMLWCLYVLCISFELTLLGMSGKNTWRTMPESVYLVADNLLTLGRCHCCFINCNLYFCWLKSGAFLKEPGFVSLEYYVTCMDITQMWCGGPVIATRTKTLFHINADFKKLLQAGFFFHFGMFVVMFSSPDEGPHWFQKSDLCWDVDRKSSSCQGPTTEMLLHAGGDVKRHMGW